MFGEAKIRLNGIFSDVDTISEALIEWLNPSTINVTVYSLKSSLKLITIRAHYLFSRFFAVVHFNFPGYWIVRVPSSPLL